MSEEQIKCPICGTMSDEGSEKCKMCQTILSKKEDGKLKVTSPKIHRKTFTTIDIEDPITRKKLEELTLIPGVTREKALYLYQSGIQTMEDFLQKAFRGEKYSENFSRTVGNKLLLQSLRGKKEEQEILCPSCDAPNPINVKNCKVCNYDIAAEMAALDMGDISNELSESVTEMMGELGENEDFEALPDELKAQFASVLDSDDIDFEMEKPEDMENLGIDLDNMDEIGEEAEISEEDIPEPSEELPEESPEPEEEIVKEAPVEESEPEEEVPEPETAQEEVTSEPEKEDSQEPEPEEVPEPAEPEPAPEPASPEATEPPEEEEAAPEEEPEKELTAKEKKVIKILSKKVDQWRKAGYDIEGLDEYYRDVEAFKVKAKECLEKGKIVRAKYEKQLEMWREKGFDVSELEPLLNKDIDAFKDKAKDVLKQQKK